MHRRHCRKDTGGRTAAKTRSHAPRRRSACSRCVGMKQSAAARLTKKILEVFAAKRLAKLFLESAAEAGNIVPAVQFREQECLLLGQLKIFLAAGAAREFGNAPAAGVD